MLIKDIRAYTKYPQDHTKESNQAHETCSSETTYDSVYPAQTW